MKRKIFWLKAKQSDAIFAIVSSIIIVGLTFSVFIGQELFSDILTYAKGGDQFQICFPAFMKLGRLLQHGVFGGVDTGTSNGATEFFLRSNIPVKYFPIMIFAYIGAVLSIPRIMYMLFYMFSLYFALYYGQRLGTRYFNMNRWVSLLLATSSMQVFLYETWTSSFAIITLLVFPLLYFALRCIDGYDKKVWILLPLPYVFGLTSGYITVSLALVLGVVTLAIIYGFLYKKELSKVYILKSILAPVIASGIICFLYYLNVLIYVKSVVKPGGTTLYNSLMLNLNVKDLASVVLSSYTTVSGIEQLYIINIGVLWAIVIFIILNTKSFTKMKKEEAIIFKLGIIITMIMIIISFGVITPFGTWFYSLFPVFGQGHLPIRYIMLTMPITFISLCIGLNSIPDGKDNLIYKKMFWSLIIIALVFAIISTKVNITTVNTERFMLEMLGVAIVLYTVYLHGWRAPKTLFLWSSIMVLTGGYVFNLVHEVNLTAPVLTERSVIYDDNATLLLNGFIDSLPDKDQYKFAHFDSTTPVPQYIPSNYEWYYYGKYNLANYIGYELHLCLPKDYATKMGSYNMLNWLYAANTRGDFIITDQASIDTNVDMFNLMADWVKSSLYINSRFRVVQLKKFIPAYYTQGQAFVLDPNENSLDNGYFYSPYLTNDNLISFETDKSTYFSATIDSDSNTDIAFLSHPNRNYKYYVDGKEITPIIYDMQAFININEGQHTLLIKYQNTTDFIGTIILNFYYCISIILLLFIYINSVLKNKQKKNLHIKR